MKGLRGVFPGFVLGEKKATRGLREGGRSLEGSCFDKNAPETASGLILDVPIPRGKPNGWGKRD